VTEFAALIAMT